MRGKHLHVNTTNGHPGTCQCSTYSEASRGCSHSPPHTLSLALGSSASLLCLMSSRSCASRSMTRWWYDPDTRGGGSRAVQCRAWALRMRARALRRERRAAHGTIMMTDETMCNEYGGAGTTSEGTSHVPNVIPPWQRPWQRARNSHLARGTKTAGYHIRLAHPRLRPTRLSRPPWGDDRHAVHCRGALKNTAHCQGPVGGIEGRGWLPVLEAPCRYRPLSGPCGALFLRARTSLNLVHTDGLAAATSDEEHGGPDAAQW